MRKPRVVVIGAGIGGLTAALELANASFSVCVCEAQDDIGGKLKQTVFEGWEGIDCGPTVFTMRWIFDDLFRDLGLRFEDFISLEKLDLLARHAWPDGATLDLFSSEERTADAIAVFAGGDEARRYIRFCAAARQTFETLDATYMRASRPGVAQLVGRIARSHLPGLATIHPFRSLWSELTRHFQDPRLIQLFGRYATYCGASPFEAPGTLMLIAHAEQRGVWLIDGGMKALALLFARLSRDLGAEVRTSSAVKEILVKDRSVTGVVLANGERLEADAVVFNGDVNALASGCLGPALAAAGGRLAYGERSQSALTWSLVGSGSGFDLAPHTVFFSADYQAEFENVFKRKKLPGSPTVYVHAPDRPPDGRPMDGGEKERLFVLVNAPALADGTDITAEEQERCEESMLSLMRRVGLNLQWQQGEMVRTSPQEFARRFPASQGALYGRVAHGWRSSFQRPGSKGPLKGLYLAGGSVHPGPGVPMATLSGRLAARSLLNDFHSRVPYRQAGIIGGMSTA